MKKVFDTGHNNKSLDAGILIARLSIAGFMLVHGFPKLDVLLRDEPIRFMSFMGLSPEITLALVVFAEVICSILILVGFGTRLATVPLIFTMIVAVFFVHSNDGFGKQEIGMHYLLVYLLLLILGSGKYSVDRLIYKRQLAIENRNIYLK